MARQYCQGCNKPLNMCICHLFLAINNNIKLLILQHPKEVSHSKGSLPLLAHSLTNIQCVVGENFAEQPEVIAQICQAGSYLLYPDDNAITPAQLTDHQAIKQLVVIDASWKKSYRMYQLNRCLQQLPKIALSNIKQSRYDIRHTNKKDALSTLEACCYSLMSLDECNTKQYQQLLNNFSLFNQQWLSFTPRK